MISNFGNIYDNYRKCYTSQKQDKDGYMTCSIICNDRYMKMKVHRLIAMVFDYIPDPEKYQINHIDGVHHNNIISNLEWVDNKNNSCHSMLTGLHVMNGSMNPNSKLSENDIHEICKLIESGNYYDSEIAKLYNVSCTNISDIHNGKIWVNITRNYDLSKRKSRKQ